MKKCIYHENLKRRYNTIIVKKYNLYYVFIFDFSVGSTHSENMIFPHSQPNFFAEKKREKCPSSLTFQMYL